MFILMTMTKTEASACYRQATHTVQPRTSFVRNIDYPEHRLSRLAGDQEIYYYTCAEDVANDSLWVWSQVEQ